MARAAPGTGLTLTSLHVAGVSGGTQNVHTWGAGGACACKHTEEHRYTLTGNEATLRAMRLAYRAKCTSPQRATHHPVHTPKGWPGRGLADWQSAARHCLVEVALLIDRRQPLTADA